MEREDEGMIFDDEDDDPFEEEQAILREAGGGGGRPAAAAPAAAFYPTDDDDESEDEAPRASAKAAGKRPMPPPRGAAPPPAQRQRRAAPAALAPIRGGGRPRPSSAGGLHDDDQMTEQGDGVSDDDDDDGGLSDDLSDDGAGAFERGAREAGAAGDDGEASEASGGDGSASVAGESASGNERLHMALEDMPGWQPMIMGVGIKAFPTAFATGESGYWAQWQFNDKLFKAGCEPIPARTLCVTFLKAFLANDAQRIGEWETHADPMLRARAVAAASIIGMLTTGTSKGWVCSKEHTEVRAVKAANPNAEPDELAKLAAKLNGNIKSYTYQPNRQHRDITKREDTAMQFGWMLEEIYEESGSEVVAYRLFKQIYDETHSDDELWRQLMHESGDITRSGTINGIPEALRKTKMLQQNKLQRSQINDDDMENTASTQYKRITNFTDLIKMYKAYSGNCEGKGGRPLYANIQADTPIGCQVRPITADYKMGGKHPLGPSVALNFKRFLEPGVIAEGHPGVNVATAGLVDEASGAPLKVKAEQEDPRLYYDSIGRFIPPEWVRKKGCFFVCHDANVRNIFNIPFPRPVHGSVTPDDELLRMYWDLNKDTQLELKAAVERGARKTPPRVEYEDHKDLVGRLFHNMSKERDETAQQISEGVLDTEMLAPDSIDKSAAEVERLNMRCYGNKVATKDGDRYVLEPRQKLRDLSEEQERAHAMIDQWDAKERAAVRTEADAARRNGVPYNRGASDAKRAGRHSNAVRSCIKLGLRRFENAMASKKMSASIPPGWKEVAHKGLKTALKEAAEFGCKRAAAGVGRVVDPKDPNAKVGTANMAFAYAHSAEAKDLSPFGHWRAFLMHLFSSGVKVSGPDVRVMLECWCVPPARRPLRRCASIWVRAPQDPRLRAVPRGELLLPHVSHSYNATHTPYNSHNRPFVRRCGGPGAGKSMRAKRLQALLVEGWIKGSGSSSAKAGMNGGMDHLCGRLVYYDEITNDFGSNDSDRIEYLKSITMVS